MADDGSPAKDFSAYIEKLELRIAQLEKQQQQQPARAPKFGFQPMSGKTSEPIELGFVPFDVLLYLPGQVNLQWKATSTGFVIVAPGELKSANVLWIAWR